MALWYTFSVPQIVQTLRRLRAIASTTAAELYGQPVVLLLTLGGVAATALIPFLQLHSFGEAGRLARDGGLAYQLVIGLVLAVVAASSSLHDEVANGTAAAALAAALLFTRRTAFAPSFANLHLAVVPVALLILLALGVYAAIATALATRLRASPALVICLLLLLLGLSSDTLLAPSSPAPVRLLAALVPNLQSFWMCDALAPGRALPPLYLLHAALYAASLAAAALGAGMIAFRGKDIP